MPFADIIGHDTPIHWMQKAIASDQLGHAYLFMGEAGIGKKYTAVRLAQAMSCDRAEALSGIDSCGECRSCRQIRTQTHPDVLLIQPDPNQGQNPHIKIDRIREIEHHTIYRPLIAARKICIIDEADRLTIEASNALLKTLEEPPDHSLFIVVTSRPSFLLPTILSRCLVVRFATPGRDETQAYLMREKQLPEDEARFLSLLTHGRLGESCETDLQEALAQRNRFSTLCFGDSLRTIPDLLDSAETLSKAGNPKEAFSWVARLLRDVLLVSLNCQRHELIHPENLEVFQRLAKDVPLEGLLDLIEGLEEFEQGLNRNLNQQLGWEGFLLRLREIIPTPTR